MKSIYGIGFAAAIVLALAAAPAQAALVTYTAPMGGFTYDSDTQNGAFLAALGAGYTHLSFSGASNTDGTSYSSDVTFSTIQSSNGGTTGGNVNALNEIGPSPSWFGVLDIDFLADGNTVSAVGFGLVDAGETISVFDQSNSLIGVFNNTLNDVYALWGVAGNAGERIGRVEVDGNFFAIQDIEYNTNNASVPEPSSILLVGLGLLGLGLARRSGAFGRLQLR